MLVVPVDSPNAAGDKPLPRLAARRLMGEILLDGKLSEADWAAAQLAGPFVSTMRGDKGEFQANAKVLYDAEQLYIGFQVADDLLRSSFSKKDEHLWEQDCVEVMFDPDGDGQNYFELQVSPAGVSFDTRYDTRRQPRPFGDVEWDSQVQAKALPDGTLNDEQADSGYTVEMAIPWGAFRAGGKPADPPAAGDSWRMNFFVMDLQKKRQRAVGWSPPMIGDFHTLNRFGRVLFTKGAVNAADAPGAPKAHKAAADAPEATSKPAGLKTATQHPPKAATAAP